jgi:ketosteroid isomerase-like protein
MIMVQHAISGDFQMSNRWVALCFAFALVLAAVCPAYGLPPASPKRDGPEQAAVRKVLDRYMIALNTVLAGDADPMKDVWSHADDITYMGPTGKVLNGWKEIEKSWEFQAGRKLGGKCQGSDISIFAGKDLAVVVYLEKGNLNLKDQPVDFSIRGTTTFRLEEGNWKVIGHHTDIIPALAK